MSKRSFAKVRELNDRLIMAERAFTDDDGLFGRSWYKHLVSFLCYTIPKTFVKMIRITFVIFKIIFMFGFTLPNAIYIPSKSIWYN